MCVLQTNRVTSRVCVSRYTYTYYNIYIYVSVRLIRGKIQFQTRFDFFDFCYYYMLLLFFFTIERIR